MRFLKSLIVDKITNIVETEVPHTIKLEFTKRAQGVYPRSRASRTTDILISKDADAYNPKLIERHDN